ncbi:hypothetical protein FHE66_01965 [Georgenia sp. 311]|uniref:hypothetical protein n=1 Tax=Georgenia sp. 311 TaxID=2585134 RepID=UPI0011118A2F|nr:hypothetical protein [Georgenia sp. 311]TNC20016.1 hypothetical protein FHE66_01965 [Georgenia sp. 311]
MTAVLTERPTTDVAVPGPDAPPEGVDRDGIEVYCPDSGGWARTRDYFCESCGAVDHDLR